MTTGLVIGIFGIVVVALVIIPLMSRARRIAGDRATQQMNSRARAGVTAAYSPSRLPPPPPASGRDNLAGEAEEGATFDAASIEGRVKASSVKKVGEIVGKHPDEALAVVRSWMNKDR